MTFEFQYHELAILNGKRNDEPSASRTVILRRDGVTVERWDATVAEALVITALEGSLGTMGPEYQKSLMGDGLPRCYNLWQAISGGLGMFCYLANLKVYEKFRRHGIGGWLLQQVIDSTVAPRLFVAANPNGHLSQQDLFRFYERFGFHRLSDSTSIMTYERKRTVTEKKTEALAEAGSILERSLQKDLPLATG